MDLNEVAGPDWIDDIARRLRPGLRYGRLRKVVGHVDWHPGNFSFEGDGIKTVYDWDSLALLPEAAIAGSASVLYLQHGGRIPTVIESDAFLDAYATARGTPWTSDEKRFSWAAGLWGMAFDAKKESIDGVPRGLKQTRMSAGERLRRAGL